MTESDTKLLGLGSIINFQQHRAIIFKDSGEYFTVLSFDNRNHSSRIYTWSKGWSEEDLSMVQWFIL